MVCMTVTSYIRDFDIEKKNLSQEFQSFCSFHSKGWALSIQMLAVLAGDRYYGVIEIMV